MSIGGKIISIINIIYLLVFIASIVSIPISGGSIVAFAAGAICVAIFLIPILIGLISSIMYYQKFRKSRVVQKKMDRFLAAIPIVNFFMVFVMALLLR